MLTSNYFFERNGSTYMRNILFREWLHSLFLNQTCCSRLSNQMNFKTQCYKFDQKSSGQFLICHYNFQQPSICHPCLNDMWVPLVSLTGIAIFSMTYEELSQNQTKLEAVHLFLGSAPGMPWQALNHQRQLASGRLYNSSANFLFGCTPSVLFFCAIDLLRNKMNGQT
jgi:hypothetical protein